MSAYGPPQPYRRDYDAYDPYQDYEDTYASESYGTDPYPEDSYARGAGRATASVGAASAGRASVGRASGVASPSRHGSTPEADPDGTARPRYDWSGGQRSAGRASVPVSPAGGATGRASVSSRPSGPGGPGGPAGTGPGGQGPEGRPARKKKRHWLRNSFLALLAIMVIISGGGMLALSYYVDSVPPPAEQDLKEGSTISYANGKEMATLEEVNRQIIDTTVPELANARNAVVAVEDQDFYEHSGVDFAGIVRAAWNNLRGGPRQGASTIDQQYAGAAAGTRGEDSYSRKLEEAAMAYKLNQEYSKEEILDHYLNTIYFGRGAYGIEAAAQAYFGKSAKKLEPGEAALVAGCIRVPDDGSGLCPYDPLHTPDDQTVALDRWNSSLDNMVEIGALDPAKRAEMTELPEVVEPPSDDEARKGPKGNIVRQVERELKEMGITDVATGGYRITTTIDPKMQRAALDAARRKNKADYWQGMPKNVKSSLVAVDPATGAVLAYYGGEDGTGVDWAGPNVDEETGEVSGGWPPGSSFKIYTLIAELRDGVSFDSHWKTSEFNPDWADITVTNAGRDARTTGCEGQAPDFCTLRWSTIHSFNAPFAHYSERTENGPQKIVQAAMDAGITMMTDTREGIAHDLTAIEDASEVAPEHFFHPVAYGQYPVTVLDHAGGVATLAASGVQHDPHFVASVEQKRNGEWVQIAGDRIQGQEVILPEQANTITEVLSQVPQNGSFTLATGCQAAAKTGTWEHRTEDNVLDGNGDAWVVGYTPQIASAVWVGDPKRGAIRDQFGNDIGSGGLPAQVWKKFMEDAHTAKKYECESFPPAPNPGPGNPNTPIANGEEPAPDPPEDPRCNLPFVNCDDDDDDDDDGGFGNDGNDDGQGNTIVPPPGNDQD